jgi:hypothetical protein
MRRPEAHEGMTDLSARWLSRAWQLSAFVVLAATGLRVFDKIDPAHWAQVVTVVVPAWLALNAVEKWRKPA